MELAGQDRQVRCELNLQPRQPATCDGVGQGLMPQSALLPLVPFFHPSFHYSRLGGEVSRGERTSQKSAGRPRMATAASSAV